MPSAQPPRRSRLRLVLAVTLVGLLSAACGGGADDGARAAGDGSDRPLVVVSTSILGDVVSRSLGGTADVELLIADGGDVHDERPSARQRARLGEADLIVVIGLGAEAGLADAVAAAAGDGVPVLEVAPALGAAAGEDLHVWLDASRLAALPALVVDALAQQRPDLDVASARASATAQHDALMALDVEIAALVADLPDDRRVVVTGHEVLGRFADRYGLEVAGTLGAGAHLHGGASATDLAAAVRVLQQSGSPAIFVEVGAGTSLARTVADEAGGDVDVVELRLESMGDAASWAEVLRADAQTIVDALRP